MKNTDQLLFKLFDIKELNLIESKMKRDNGEDTNKGDFLFYSVKCYAPVSCQILTIYKTCAPGI